MIDWTFTELVCDQVYQTKTMTQNIKTEVG